MPQETHGPKSFGKKPDADRKVVEQAIREIGVDHVVIEGISIDRQTAFLSFVQCEGDLERTAHALAVPRESLDKFAEESKWEERYTTLRRIKEKNNPKDFERFINRTVNFTQVFRLRRIIETFLVHIEGLSYEELIELLYTQTTRTDKNGSISELKLNTRPWADLASALEKLHMLSYAALGDSSSERNARRKDEVEEGPAQLDICTQIARALNTPVIPPSEPSSSVS